jgi:hypothetical protein
MGRSFKPVAVVKAYDAHGSFVCEDIIPLENFANASSLILNLSEVRAARGIRFISVRRFDESGNRMEAKTFNYDLRGNEIRANHRRPDGTIIENADWL